ncbi:hypothetical protein BOX15_Mlig018926g1 [Macrostomum lignano]|uniref:Beta-galactosidase n=1 Tax=Macrostomum lignano TaxID=282301 RepID=A0A267FIC3_9PLAT|nr:hypothetical protein BOX15_Mlig018926g1 [Macrostomum lignano]
MFSRRRHSARLKLLIGVSFIVAFFFVYYVSTMSQQSTNQHEPENVAHSHIDDKEDKQVAEQIKRASLTFRDRQFYLNGVKFQILSGAIHYFRVPQDYWRDRLLKLKAAGFNTVETYAPWNLHEDTKGNFNFNGMLNVRKFFKLAQELGLYVIFRPGPFICSEWEFGGMPGWLLSDPNMRVRSMYMGFTQAAEDYLRVVINEVADLQMSRGGPIIAFQVENEYGSYGDNGRYLQHLADSMRRSGVVEALFTSDGDEGIRHAKALAGAFAGINYNSKAHAKWLQSIVKGWNPNLPIFAAELWTGWFLPWGAKDKNQVISLPDLVDSVTSLLDQGASINLYMFHGGTNFGFMNGYNGITGSPLITSYDYDAPLSENGQPTEKYHRIRELMLARLSKTAVKSLPDIPAPIPTKDYGSWPVKWTMHWDKLVEMVDKTTMSETLKFMEEVHQNYGFILYRSAFESAKDLTIFGHVADRAQVLVNGAPIDPADPMSGVVYHPLPEAAPPVTHLSLAKSLPSRKAAAAAVADQAASSSSSVLDVLVENLGRVNYATFQSSSFNRQRKGVSAAVPAASSKSSPGVQSPGQLALDGRPLRSYKIVSLDFRKPFLAKLLGSNEAWKPVRKPPVPPKVPVATANGTAGAPATAAPAVSPAPVCTVSC